MRHFQNLAMAASIILGAGTVCASADDCSGHDHYIGTAIGAVGGGLIAGMATKNVAVGLGGAAIGGLAGNAAERAMDCSAVTSKKTAAGKTHKKLARD